VRYRLRPRSKAPVRTWDAAGRRTAADRPPVALYPLCRRADAPRADRIGS